MTNKALRMTTGFGLVGAHFAILLLIGILAAFDRFMLDEMFVLFGLIAPLFAAYTTAVVRAFMKEDPHASIRGKADISRVILAIGIVTFFVLAVLCGVLWKSFGSLGMDDLIKLVGITETILGGYVGIVMESFFGPIRQES